MKKKRELTCIGCPLGCQIAVTMEENEIVKVEGNTCPRGEKYARTEVTNPMRTVTTTVKVQGGSCNVVSVKTAADIPKDLVKECIKELRGITLQAPTKIGQIVVENICNTGVDVVVTKNLTSNKPTA
ncbi:MAG: DUF1667 domain-containing protein [Eubacterium sp.]|nr:DUF1667 domain-containing protein [Eubacterium sp.]